MYTNVNQFPITNDGGSITVTNQGNYLADFGMTFLYNGDYISLSSPILTAYPYTIGIPETATDITVDMFGKPDLSLSITICTLRYPYPVTKSFILYGEPYNWGCNEVPCSSIGSIPSCNCCCCRNYR